jgi:alginate O-acetyltransferase complex protein AlgI
MIFNSLTFLTFLAIIVPLYWALPRTPKLVLIFLAGIVFYGFWRIDFLVVLFVSITFDYFSGLIIHSAKNQRTRRIFLTLSLTFNLGLLAFFKYFYFLHDAASGIGSLFGVTIAPTTLRIILPIGISFYTFHSMSYIIDIYRGFITPVRNFLLFFDYVVFFPQLVAGPILRAGEMLWQLDKRPDFRASDIRLGFSRIAIGLFLKVCIADNIAVFVDEAFKLDAHSLSAIDVLTMAFMFGFQIYFDFSAYSHIAIGSARLMGIVFPENFNFPYHSASPRIFWRRWHISLSSWIRNYVYLPLAGVKVRDRMSTGGIGIDGTGQVGGRSALFALFATWAIMGLWHGAAWTFVVWGVWHASMVAGHRMLSTLVQIPQSKIWLFLGWGVTLVLAMLGWIPFRAPSMAYTLQAWSHVLDPYGYATLNLRETTYVVAALTLLLTISVPFAYRWLLMIRARWPVASLPLMVLGWTSILTFTFIYLRPLNQFIYFQF